MPGCARQRPHDRPLVLRARFADLSVGPGLRLPRDPLSDLISLLLLLLLLLLHLSDGRLLFLHRATIPLDDETEGI